jgi:tetratricopeptide (TPR) repeat protein
MPPRPGPCRRRPIDSRWTGTYNWVAMGNPAPRGIGWVAAEEAASAIRRYEERLARDPSAPVWAPLADAYRKAGRGQEAIALCRDGLARFPEDTAARLVLVRALIDEEQLEDAQAELDAVIAANPRDAEARRLAGELHLRAGRGGEARRHLDAAVDLDPDNRDAQYLLEVVAADGRMPEGSPLARALADDLFATRTVAAVCLDQGLLEEAAQICLRILRTDPDDPRARAMLAQSLRPRTAKRRGG